MPECGIVSIDLLIGISIFLLSLMMVFSVFSGTLTGVRSERIDYDAVAYRTSVIICEDPGWPATDPPWEQYYPGQEDSIERFGLSVSGSTPCILSEEKISALFGTGGRPGFTDSDFQSKLFFGETEYQYNISLRAEGGPSYMAGEPVPESGYGYMRRLVRIKEPLFADIDTSAFSRKEVNVTGEDPQVTTEFSVIFDYGDLGNRSVGDEYRFMPESETAFIRISGLNNTSDNSGFISLVLNNVRFEKDGIIVPLEYGEFDNETYRFSIDGVPATMEGPTAIDSSGKLELELDPPLPCSDGPETTLSVVFNMTYTFVPGGSDEHHYISGEAPYGYGYEYMNGSVLRPGVLEVAIW